MSTTPADDEPLPAQPVFASDGLAIAPALIAAAAVLVMHAVLPDHQRLPPWLDSLPFWQLPFAVVLESILAAALALSVVSPFVPVCRAWLRWYGPLLAGAIVVLGIWDLLTQKSNWMRFPYFPGPDLVLAGMIEDAGWLVESTGHSLLLLMSGYLIGVAAGVATGVAIGWFPHVRFWGMPALKVVGPLPATALVPLVMMLSNESFLPAVALIAWAVWFPVTILTVSGIASVRVAYLDVARTLGARPAYLILHVALPAALPHIFLGMFMGLGASFLTLMVAESAGVRAGLGVYILTQKGYMDYAKVYGALAITIVFFSGLMTLLFKIRDRVLRWQKGIIQW